MFQEIYVIDEHEELTEELKKLFAKEEKLKFRQIETKNAKMIFKNFLQNLVENIYK